MPSANRPPPTATAKPKLVISCSDRTRATRLAASANGFRRRVHVAGAEQPHELVAEMVAVEQDEDDEDDDDADGEQRMQQGRHEGGDALEIGPAALHAHRRRRRGPVSGRGRGRARRPWP